MYDKTKHVLAGGLIGLLTLPIAFTTGSFWGALIILIIGTVISVFKEVYDKFKENPTGFDKMDIVADYIGLACGFVVSFIVYHLIQIFRL